jgi:hypothetical protein
MFQNVKIESIKVVMIAKEVGSAKAAIAPLHVVHFHPSTHQLKSLAQKRRSLPALETYLAGRYMANCVPEYGLI